MLVYFAVILTVLIGFCGLAVDTGLIESRTLQLQAAADAGAIGAATEIAYGSTSGSDIQLAANSDVAAYESLNGLPSTAPNSFVVGVGGDYSTIGETIQQSVSTIFMGVVSNASKSVSLSATAVASFPPCLYFMGTPNLNNGFNSLNTQSYEVASAGVDPPFGCPIYAQNGVSIDYFAHLYGMQVKVTGPSSASYYTGGYSVPPLYNVPSMSDPLAYLTAPSAAACANATPLSYTASVTLTPGTYCGKTTGSTTTPAISVSGTYSGGSCATVPVVTFSPGLYVIIGGIYFSCVTVTGTGVTMYFTNKSGVNYGTFSLNSSTWNVSAPTTSAAGGLPGIVIFGDRNWSGGNQDFDMGGSTWYGDGVIYVNKTGIYDWQTSMSAPHYLNIVAANMYQYGSEVRPSINYATLPTGNPLQTVITLVQ